MTTSNLMQTVSAIIKANGLSSNQTLTNAEKNYQLRCELISLYTDDGESFFLAEIEKTILAFPAGKIKSHKMDEKTGEVKEKAIEYRDAAKKLFVKAFGNAREELGFSDQYSLKFKLSVPEIEQKTKTEKTLSDQLAKLFGDTIDSYSLSAIIHLAEESQAYFENDKIELHAQFSVDQQVADLLTHVDAWKASGVTQTMAETIAGSKFAKLSEDTIYDTIAANW